VIGDGSQPPTIIAGDKLSDKNTLIKLGKEAVLPQAIGKVGATLSDKVFRYVCRVTCYYHFEDLIRNPGWLIITTTNLFLYKLFI
jgi:hypothetical protein